MTHTSYTNNHLNTDDDKDNSFPPFTDQTDSSIFIYQEAIRRKKERQNLIAQKIKQLLNLAICNFFIFFLTYHALNQVKNVDQSLSFVQKFSELMQKTFSTQGIFNFSSSSKLLFAGKIALFALAAISFGLFVFKLISENNYEKRENFKNNGLNLLTTQMIKSLFVAFVPFLIPVIASLYNQNSTILMISSLIVAAWYMLSAIINNKDICIYYHHQELNHKPISYLFDSEDNKTTKLFNLLKTLPSTIIDWFYESFERVFIIIIDCFLAIFQGINKIVEKINYGVDFCVEKIFKIDDCKTPTKTSTSQGNTS